MAFLSSSSSNVTFTPTAAAYGAGDVMSTAKEFSAIAPPDGGMIEIISTSLYIADTAVVAGQTSFTLHLYNVTPPSAHADNDAWDLPATDLAAYLGSLALGTPADLGSNEWIAVDNIHKLIKVSSSTSGGSIWAELITVGAHTAAATAHKVVINSIWR